ncbi:MAG TPA: CHASE3 domain-containing protein [Amycolatopsis sp.]|nr:CHASE3 domain-containing protein [Amycolatopsis sp.]
MRPRWPRTLRWRVYVLVGGMLLLLFITAVATTLAWRNAYSIGQHLRNSLRPAQVSAVALTTGYLDMETGERGFLLTRQEQFLAPYTAGRTIVGQQTARLRGLLVDDPESLRLIDAAEQMGTTWLRTSITPELDAARAGTLSPDALTSSMASGKTLFDNLRARLTDLQARIESMTTTGLQSNTSAQSLATSITVGCVVAALVLGMLTVLLLRRSLDQPLGRLMMQVRRVAAGELDQRVDANGPAELAELGGAVESMRVHAIASSAQVGRLEEADRIARELADTVIRQLFAVGLSLQSMAARFPAAGPACRIAVADVDKAINQLRAAVYGPSPPQLQALGVEVQALLGEVEEGVGVVPDLVLSGDLDHELPEPVVSEVLGVLHDALRAVLPAEPVHIGLTRTGGRLLLHLVAGAPEGASRHTLTALPERARLLGGDGEVGYADDRVVIDWWVPV